MAVHGTWNSSVLNFLSWVGLSTYITKSASLDCLRTFIYLIRLFIEYTIRRGNQTLNNAMLNRVNILAP